MLAELRLFQLISPSLPVGSFTYSQGVEWAVEADWINDSVSFEAWLEDQIQQALVTLELPMLRLLYQAAEREEWSQFDRLTRELLAWRETRELRAEEQQRGAALMRLLPELDIEIPEEALSAAKRTQLAGIALAGVQWKIELPKLLLGHLWSWLENLVMAGVKLIPLGQTQGQQLMLRMAKSCEKAVARSLEIEPDQLGSTTPSLAIASSKHEQQYTRLFRS